MDITKILRKLYSLQKIADRQRGSPEGDNAAAMIARIQEQNDIRIPAEDLEHLEKTISADGDYSHDIAMILRDMLPIEIAMGTKEIHFRGMKIAVDEAIKHYNEIKEGVEYTCTIAAIGHLMGTFGTEAVLAYVSNHQDASSKVRQGLETKAEQFEEPEKKEFTGAHGQLIRGALKVGKPIELWQGIERG